MSCLHLEAITTVNTVNILVTLKNYFMPLCDPSPTYNDCSQVSSLSGGSGSALCQCRSVCVFRDLYEWNHMVLLSFRLFLCSANSVICLCRYIFNSSLLCSSLAFYCINMPQLVYPFNCWWTTVLLTVLVCYI